MMCPQQLRDRPWLARRPAGMARPGTARALALACLEHDDRLACRSGAIKRGTKAIRLTGRLDEQPHHRRARVLDQVLDIVGHAEYCLIARGDDVAEPEASDIRQQANADGSALRDEANVTRKLGRVAQLTQIRRTRMMGVEDAHAI